MLFLFPPFRLDPTRRQFTREGQPIELTPKEFDTLLVLVEAGGAVVEKETLIGQVWSDSFVGDGSLARNISVLRKELGKDVIETLPRRGYRITLPISVIKADPAPMPPKPHTVASNRAEPIVSYTPPALWWRKRKVAIASAVAAIVLVTLFGSRSSLARLAGSNTAPPKAGPVTSLVIERHGAVEPLEVGFKIGAIRGFSAYVMHNPANNGYDRWRVVSDEQGYYYRPLSRAERDFALQRDWKLTCTCSVERGLAHANIDFGDGTGMKRFDIHLVQEGKKYFVGLERQISPELQWDYKAEFAGAGDVDYPHTYELRYDHTSRTASLWIDGQMKAAGYRGLDQYRENVGLNFGAASYLDAKQGIGVFREVRFEAH
jgi:DNA-binding winged helix-turn-helix (wHTH) protein